MHIAVDARELCGRPAGVGRYLSELLQEWATSPQARRHDWRLYAHATPITPPAFSDRVHVLPGAGGTKWEQWTFARALAADRPDVLFAPGYTAPLTAPCPVALTVHDVSFAAHPEWFSAREGLRRRVLTRWSARRARMVLTDSNFSKNEIMRFLRIPDARVRVVPLGMRSVQVASRAPREPLILYVGSLFVRRHVLPLIAAFVSRVMPAVPRSQLVLVGENRMYPAYDFRELTEGPAEWRARVSLKSYVSDDELRHLYGTASTFAFLSEYEGFGLTPLEALAAGVPPVVLDTPVAHEIYGTAARFVARGADLEAAIGDALIEMLTSEGARTAVLRQAPAVLARYRWDVAATATLRAIEEAAGA